MICAQYLALGLFEVLLLYKGNLVGSEFSKVSYAHSTALFCSRFQACLLDCISYHVFESILNRSDHQALLWNLLLGKEARGWASRWARCPRRTPQRCCPGERTLRRRGEVMIDGLLSQTRGSQQVGSAEDLHHLLKVQRDVMMQEVWSHDGSPGASVAVKQRPVVQHQIFRSVLCNGKRKTEIRNQTKTITIAHHVFSKVRLCVNSKGVFFCSESWQKAHWRWGGGDTDAPAAPSRSLFRMNPPTPPPSPPAVCVYINII